MIIRVTVRGVSRAFKNEGAHRKWESLIRNVKKTYELIFMHSFRWITKTLNTVLC